MDRLEYDIPNNLKNMYHIFHDLISVYFLSTLLFDLCDLQFVHLKKSLLKYNHVGNNRVSM